jgi:hypothetical protein
MYIFCLKLVCQRRMAHVSFSIKIFVLHLSIVFLVNPSSLVASSPQDLFLCEFPFCNRFSRRQHGLHAARFSCPAILLFSGLHVGGFLFPLARRSAGSFSRSGVDRVFLTPLVFGPKTSLFWSHACSEGIRPPLPRSRVLPVSTLGCGVRTRGGASVLTRPVER